MIFEYNNVKYCVNCDWLQYSVHLSEENPKPNCPDGYRIELLQGNNIFKHRAMIFDKTGRKWLTCLWMPYSSRLNKYLMTVQVANELLYQSAINASFRLLEQCFPAYFNSMGRIDICCDFEGTDDFIKNLNDLNDASSYIQGKKEGSSWWHEIRENNGYFNKQLHCLTFGSARSEIKLKIYHKSRELGLLGGLKKENREMEAIYGVEDQSIDCHKPYIVSEWETAGFNKKRVWRMEFSISGANQIRQDYKSLTLDDVASDEWKVRSFLGLYNSRCVIRKNQGGRRGHKNLDEVIRLLDLPTELSKLKWAETQSELDGNISAIPIIRSMMTKISDPIIMSNDEVFTSYATAICDLVNHNRLSGWFKSRFGDDVQVYMENIYQNVGTQVVEVAADPIRFFD